MSRRAVFLDRDGVLNRERGFVLQPAELEPVDGLARDLRSLSEAGYLLVVITNQSAVARALLDWPTLRAIHERLQRAADGALDAIYVCPHHPSAGATPMTRACNCRKPSPGLLQRAARDLHLDLARSWLIGDAPRDVAAAHAVGAQPILVCGEKCKSAAQWPAQATPPVAFVQDLTEATAHIAEARAGQPN